MVEALFVVERDDPGAALLAAAFRRHGWRCRVLDLRYSRPTIDAGIDAGSDARSAATVSVDGNTDVPDVVLNRTATSGLGLPPPEALDRQLPRTWSGRHVAAREEQGLLLAAFDCWDRSGRLYNPVRTLDRHLVGAAVPDRPDVLGDGRRGACWIVDGTVVAACAELDGKWRPVAISAATVEVARSVAAAADLRLGQIDFWQARSGTPSDGTTVTAWNPAPRFRALLDRTGIDIAAAAVAAIVGEPPATAPSLLAADLETNLLNTRTADR